MDFVFDKANVLVRLGGDQEIFAVVIDMYLQDVDNVCARLATSLAADDAVALRREAHTVKGLLATFADEVGSDLALAVEVRAKHGECTGLRSMVTDLQARLQTVAAALRQEIAV